MLNKAIETGEAIMTKLLNEICWGTAITSPVWSILLP
jgi:hypothetical protein